MLIELPLPKDGKVWVNPDHVTAVSGMNGFNACCVEAGEDCYSVAMPRDEVAALINAACAKREVPGE